MRRGVHRVSLWAERKGQDPGKRGTMAVSGEQWAGHMHSGVTRERNTGVTTREQRSLYKGHTLSLWCPQLQLGKSKLCWLMFQCMHQCREGRERRGPGGVTSTRPRATSVCEMQPSCPLETKGCAGRQLGERWVGQVCPGYTLQLRHRAQDSEGFRRTMCAGAQLHFKSRSTQGCWHH